MFGNWQMSATIKDVSSKRADEELHADKGNFAMFENASHQGVAFSGDVRLDPNESQLSVKPVQRK